MEPELTDWVTDAITQEQAMVERSAASTVAVTSAWSPTLASAWTRRERVWLASVTPALVLAAASLPLGLAATMISRSRPTAGVPFVVMALFVVLLTSLQVRVDISQELWFGDHGARRGRSLVHRAGLVTASAVTVSALCVSVAFAGVCRAAWMLALGGRADAGLDAMVWLLSVPVAGAVAGLAWPAVFLSMEYDRGPLRSLVAALRVTGRKAPAWMFLGLLAQAATTVALVPAWFGIVELWRRGLSPYTSPMVLAVTTWTVFAVPWCLGAAELLFSIAWRRDTGPR